MSALVSSPQGAGVPAPAAIEFQFTQTESFVERLRALGSTLLVSTYQANKLLAARVTRDGLSILVRTFERPMGMAVAADRLIVGTRNQVWEFRNAPDIASRIEPAGTHDACFLPRHSHVTGDIGVHELTWAGNELWLVNTRFSCLCTLATDYSSSLVGGRNSYPPWWPRIAAILMASALPMADQDTQPPLGRPT